ncbi:MAG: DNA replication/repair protein RecF [Pseudomonadota bacterium]
METNAIADPTVQQADQPSGRVWLSRLMITDFRSYDLAEVHCDHRPVVLTGPNGAGKTNLLEAISLLAPGRGLRQVKLSDIARRNAACGKPGSGPFAWAVAADVATPTGPRRLGTGSEGGEDGRRERRLIRVDDAPARGQQAFSEILSIVWLTPQMDGLLREGASGRRRFLDRLVFGLDPTHASRVSAYEHSLRERARLLKSGNHDGDWLTSLEDSMARHGVAIAAARRDLISRLTHLANHEVGPFPGANLALKCEVVEWLDEQPALVAEDRLRERLAVGRGQDEVVGGASVGSHRSDLVVHHRAKQMPAHLCSTGEQKALLIAITLAFARLLSRSRGAAPLLLLDEVVAHLDDERRRALFEEIVALGVQAWMTGTDETLFAGLGEQAQFFQIREAKVVPTRAASVQ